MASTCLARAPKVQIRDGRVRAKLSGKRTLFRGNSGKSRKGHRRGKPEQGRISQV